MSGKEYNLKDFYFDLPEELIAQYPSDEREGSRLFILDRKNNEYSHKRFADLPDYLNEGDLMIFNNARVIKARLFFIRKSGGRIEIILTEKISGEKWIIITNRTKRLNPGEVIHSEKDPDIKFTIIERMDEKFVAESSIPLTEEVLNRIGNMPLPPYIKRNSALLDDDRYQTVYASNPGAVAAPTAGLHFSDGLLQKIRDKGVETADTTLDVSWGTFQPVRSYKISEHRMHKEKYTLTEDSAEKINRARNDNRKIIAVGTTSLRVMETTFDGEKNVPGTGYTDIFIYPPKKIKSVSALITNFHTPNSTLLMLVCAFAGYDTVMKAYNEAVKERYRFFSYGDSMFIS